MQALFCLAWLMAIALGFASAQCEPSSPLFCRGTSQNGTLNGTYLCGDYRLGPAKLPSNLAATVVIEPATYNRLGGLCPGQFLATFFDDKTGNWDYPPADGFQLNTAGEAIADVMTLPSGTLIDRFGSENGYYAGPAWVPFLQRALPPSSLNTPSGSPGSPVYPYNYHVYRTTSAIEVVAGPVAGWFGQPGQGMQYLFNNTILTLINSGCLERVNITLA